MPLTQNIFVNTAVYAAAIPFAPTHDHSAGVVTPHVGNGAMSLLRNVIVTGYFTGIVCNEHTDGDAINGTQHQSVASANMVCSMLLLQLPPVPKHRRARRCSHCLSRTIVSSSYLPSCGSVFERCGPAF